MLCFQWGRRKAIRMGNHKLVCDEQGENVELYDLETDLGEAHNLADRQPEIVRELSGRLDRWLKSAAGDN